MRFFTKAGLNCVYSVCFKYLLVQGRRYFRRVPGHLEPLQRASETDDVTSSL